MQVFVMAGETDLNQLLRNMEPVLHAQDFRFAFIPNGRSLDPDLKPMAMVAEDEGLTIVTPSRNLAGKVYEMSGPMARITLMVHSSLEAVGLTAAVAAALTAQKISANVIAGYKHDHIFVRWDHRDAAMAALKALSAHAAAV
jgi:uncharacterized protein